MVAAGASFISRLLVGPCYHPFICGQPPVVLRAVQQPSPNSVRSSSLNPSTKRRKRERRTAGIESHIIAILGLGERSGSLQPHFIGKHRNLTSFISRTPVQPRQAQHSVIQGRVCPNDLRDQDVGQENNNLAVGAARRQVLEETMDCRHAAKRPKL